MTEKGCILLKQICIPFFFPPYPLLSIYHISLYKRIFIFWNIKRVRAREGKQKRPLTRL